MKKIGLILLLAFLYCNICAAQKERILPFGFELMYSDSPLIQGTDYALNNGGSIQINTLRFYVSDISLYDGNTRVWQEQDSYHLIDIADNQSRRLVMNVPMNISFNTITFNLGIDSTTNVSGAMGGDLDPTKGMYWTWQSGYINFKIEGIYTANSIKKEVQYHLGGYAAPNATVQKVMLQTSSTERILINVDIARFINNIDLGKQTSIMIPCNEAVELSSKAASIFSIKE